MRGQLLSLVFVLGAVACGGSSSSSAPSTTTTSTSTDSGGGTDAVATIDAPTVDGKVVTIGLGDAAGAVALGMPGETCRRDSDCYLRGCLQPGDGFPGGYCAPDCRLSKACPMGASCVKLNADVQGCYHSCTSDADCRTNYYCLDTGAALLISGGQKICFATGALLSCNVDADCPPSVPHCMGGTPPDAGPVPVDDSGAEGGGAPMGAPNGGGTGTCGM